ncbi:MAG: hypothetical protein ABFC24_06370 [Methanoregulaceae archaeon]
MTQDTGTLSIDFLVGFTIFLVALIAVANMVPGLLVDLRTGGIDYDAVAYRTGVILTEDPGTPTYPAWEQINITHKDEIIRMGLAIDKDTPGILSPLKIERFFEGGFSYPDDYNSRVIFGEHPYNFNISLAVPDTSTWYSVGDSLPDGYGYIRRGVMVKKGSNATVDAARFQVANAGNKGDNSSNRVLNIQLNLSALRNSSIPHEYRIDPLHERIPITITNISGTLYDAYNKSWKKDLTQLSSVRIYVGGSYIPPDRQVYIDGSSYQVVSGPVTNNISLILEPDLLTQIADTNSNIVTAFTFDSGITPKNTTMTGTFLYDYNPVNVTQPRLNPGVMEIAVW